MNYELTAGGIGGTDVYAPRFPLILLALLSGCATPAPEITPDSRIINRDVAALAVSALDERRLPGLAVVLANLGDARTESIEQPIARRLLGLPEPDFRIVPLSQEARQRYTGSYDIGSFDVRVVDRDGVLWLEMPRPGPTTPLRHLGGGEFAGDDPEAVRVTFDHAAGSVDTLRVLMAGLHWYGQRRR